MRTVLLYAFSLTVAYIVATVASNFIEQSFANATANFEQMGERK